MSQTTQLIQTSSGRTILDIALQKGHVKLLQYLVKEKKIAFTSQNSGQDQEAVWKALGLILRSKSDDKDDDDDDGVEKHGNQDLENEKSSMKKMEMKVTLPSSRSNVKTKKEEESDDGMVPFREIGNSCHEKSFNMSLAMNEKINNVGNQLFDLIGDFDDDYDYEDDESSTGSEGTYEEKQNKKTAVWMRRRNERMANKKDSKKDSKKERGRRRKSKLKTVDTQQLSKMKLEQYNLRSESALETKGSEESDTDLLMCNFSCPVFQENCDSFWD